MYGRGSTDEPVRWGRHEQRGRSVTTQIEPGALLKQVTMPGWMEMRRSRITLRTDAATRFAACALDGWQQKPAVAAPQEITTPRSVAIHEIAVRLCERRGAWTFLAVIASLAAVVFDLEYVAVVVVWVCWLVVVVGSRSVREYTSGPAAGYRRRVEAAEQAAQRRQAPELSNTDMAGLVGMLATTEGKLAYAAAVLAGETESSPVWRDPVFDDFHARVDLYGQVAEIAGNAREIDRARKKLGPRPGGALAGDEAVTELYERHVHQLDERLSVLTQRVHGLMIYRDHVRGFEPLIEKRRWLEMHRGDHLDVGSGLDELGAAELRSATDDIDSRTREAMRFLLDDAERLSRL